MSDEFQQRQSQSVRYRSDCFVANCASDDAPTTDGRTVMAYEVDLDDNQASISTTETRPKRRKRARRRVECEAE
ncbi:unnamed protein product [Nippostrongylus brasiliensis]|uniref:Uncharacterized protein n=1 Tax=Nippostrongylus brasiliensis TaxID=27835 RepID=A0A0N4YBG4_NIPBR|nr:unnamed protein product [Nippostrongylus brasiliensis]